MMGMAKWQWVFLLLISAAAVAAPTETSAPPAGGMALEGKHVTIDLSAAPDLKPWAQRKLLPVCEEWYPKIGAMLPSPGYTPPAHVKIRFRSDLNGTPAVTSGTDVSCNVDWFRRNLDGEAAGAVVHELVHVVQHYGHSPREGKSANAGWLVEGIADYIRWFKYEPQTHGADVRDPARARYDASYRVTAAFLDWATRTYGPRLVGELNAAMRAGEYEEAVWRRCTGKTAAELGEQWKQSLRAAGSTTRAAGG